VNASAVDARHTAAIVIDFMYMLVDLYFVKIYTDVWYCELSDAVSDVFCSAF